MTITFPFPDKVSQASQATTDFKYVEAMYGDGYRQRAKDGINNIIDSWDVVWTTLNLTDRNTLISTLEGSNGTENFSWTPPGESTSKKFVINGPIRWRTMSGNKFSVSCNFVQDFAL